MVSVLSHITNKQSKELSLYYVHSDNPNNGDGSVNNPYKNFTLLNAFFDANPTIVGATVIVLGGTFDVFENIYRGSSFFFFPGTKIRFYTGNNSDYLLQDNNSYDGYDSNFFLQGGVDIEIYGGGFIDLGYYFSNSDKSVGKRWTINIASLIVNGNEIDICKVYGSINTYDISVDSVRIFSPNSNFFLVQKDERNLVNITTIANSGCTLSTKFSTFIVSASSFNFIKTGIGQYDFLGRTPFVSIGQLMIASFDFTFFVGKINRSRKMLFTIDINNIFSNISIGGGNNYMINNNQANYSASESAYFVFENTKFTYNTAFGIVVPLVLAATANQVWLFPVFKNCTRTDDAATKTTDDANLDGCYDIAGSILTVFNDKNNSLCNSIINN